MPVPANGGRRLLIWMLIIAAVAVAGGWLRGWLVPAQRGDLAPEAYGWRIRLPWAPRAEIRLFFPTPDDSLWVMVRRYVPEASPRAALRELSAGPPSGSGLTPAWPAGVKAGDISVTGEAVEVRLDGPALSPDAPGVRRALAAMARTLAGQFLVRSIRAVSSSGQDLGVLEIAAGDDRVFYLWHGRPVPVAAVLPDGPSRPAAAVRRVLSGPAPAAAAGPPGGVSLLDVRVEGDLARVSLDLSAPVTSELIAGRWLFAPVAMAIVYTLTDLPGLKRVQFDFPNLPPEARRQCRTPLGVPLSRPDAEPALVK